MFAIQSQPSFESTDDEVVINMNIKRGVLDSYFLNIMMMIAKNVVIMKYGAFQSMNVSGRSNLSQANDFP